MSMLAESIQPMLDRRIDFDADAVEALAFGRQTVWYRICNANFLTPNEKRVAAGYSPQERGDMLDTQTVRGAP